MKSVLPAAALLLAMGVASHAQIAASIEQPQCYEGVGCPHRDRITAAQIRDFPCDFLWLVRNTIFHQRGVLLPERAWHEGIQQPELQGKFDRAVGAERCRKSECRDPAGSGVGERLQIGCRVPAYSIRSSLIVSYLHGSQR